MKPTNWGQVLRWLGALVLASAFAVTCGGQGDGAGRSADPCGDYARGGCDFIARCVPNYLVREYGDVETCRARQRIACFATVAWPGTSWTQGKFSTCGQELARTECFSDVVIDACQVSPGSFADGALCMDDSQCSGGTCELSSEYSTASPSAARSCAVCRSREERCGNRPACSRPRVCVDGECVVPVGEGAPCYGAVCVSGLSCIDGVCAKLLGPGAACRSGCDWTQGLECIDNVCQKPTFVEPGSTCDGYRVSCTAGARCMVGKATTTKTCMPRAADGDPCEPPWTICLYPADCRNGVCTFDMGEECVDEAGPRDASANQ